MKRYLAALSIALAATLCSARSPPADRLHSAGCAQALLALQAQEAAALSERAGRAARLGAGTAAADAATAVQPLAANPRWAASQRDAAAACLGARADAAPPRAALRTPLTLAPAAPDRAAQPREAPLPPQPLPQAPTGALAQPPTLPPPPAPLPPAIGSRAAAPPGSPAVQMPAAPVRIEPPVTVHSCDPTGCWSSGGTRLDRMGPHLVGPRGLCSLQGNVLQCP